MWNVDIFLFDIFIAAENRKKSQPCSSMHTFLLCWIIFLPAPTPTTPLNISFCFPLTLLSPTTGAGGFQLVRYQLPS